MYYIKNNIVYKLKHSNSKHSIDNENTKFLQDFDASNKNIIVVDNFYDDPIKIREFALSQNIKIKGVYHPGFRSCSFIYNEMKTTFEKILNKKITLFHSDDANSIYNGSFFLNTKKDEINIKSICHTDMFEWACIIYLTPHTELHTGTSFFQNNDDKRIERIDNAISPNYDYTDPGKWNLVTSVGNIFNRAIFFKSNIFHNPTNYFGKEKTDGILSQVFWFNTHTYKCVDIVPSNITQHLISNNLFKCGSFFKDNFMIVDNFYNNPDKVRNFAISQNYYRKGNHPGFRTRSFASTKMKDKLQEILNPLFNVITEFDIHPEQCNGSFQYALKKDISWIHADYNNNWAGVLFLTPNAPLNSGTLFYKYKNEIMYYEDAAANINEINSSSQSFENWNMVDRIGNIYNRLILFNSKIFHISDEYFGTNIQNGRLFQVFFFSTQKCI